MQMLCLRTLGRHAPEMRHCSASCAEYSKVVPAEDEVRRTENMRAALLCGAACVGEGCFVGIELELVMIVADDGIADPGDEWPLASYPGEEGRKGDDRHQRAKRYGDGQHAAEALQTAMAGKQQAAVADECREGIDRDGHGGAGGHAVAALLFQKFVDDVDAVIDADAKDDRHGDQVGWVQRRIHVAQQAKRDGDAHELWNGCQGNVFQVAKIEVEDTENHNYGKEGGVFVAAFHFQRALVRLQWIAGGARIDAANVVNKTSEGVHVPDVAAAVDFQQELAVLSDEAADQAGR